MANLLLANLVTRYSSWKEARKDREKRGNQGGVLAVEGRRKIDRAMERKMDGGGVLMTQ